MYALRTRLAVYDTACISRGNNSDTLCVMTFGRETCSGCALCMIVSEQKLHSGDHSPRFISGLTGWPMFMRFP